MRKLLPRAKLALRALGEFQAQVLLAVVFFGAITPYALVLRGLRLKQRPKPGWQRVDDPQPTLATLRRTY